jgi:hypothetical protein
MEDKLEELKEFKNAIKKAGGPGDEFEEHVFWLCDVAEGSYCIPDEVEKTFWECIDKMLDDTLETLKDSYELKTVKVKILERKD